jgi:hypothetical protein
MKQSANERKEVLERLIRFEQERQPSVATARVAAHPVSLATMRMGLMFPTTLFVALQSVDKARGLL